MFLCPNCGAPCQPGTPACSRCGAPLPAVPGPAANPVTGPAPYAPPPAQPYPPQAALPPQAPPPPSAPLPVPPAQPAPTPSFTPTRPGLPPPAFLRSQFPFTWKDILAILGFVSSLTGYFFASVFLLPLGLIASILGFRGHRNKGLAVAGIVISAIGVFIKLMLILREAALLPQWFTNGIW